MIPTGNIRSLLAGAAVLAINALGLSLLPYCGLAATVDGDAVRCVSLKVLQKHVLASPDRIKDEDAELAGITTLLGYVSDETNQDIVLYGLADTASTNHIETEDFCVALRNLWMMYAGRQGNIYHYTYPGCSIDPVEDTQRRLNSLEQIIHASEEQAEVESQLKQWVEICHEWQKVRVLGTPWHCGFAATAVKADYDMKLLVDGNDPLPIPGFNSLMGMRLEAVRAAIAKKSRIPVPASSMNRFWFYPGTNHYVEDDGIVWIKQCPVVLLTEAMALGPKNGYGGLGRTEPMAERFVSDFSQVYEKIAEIRPVYTDLENLFRLFILGQIIRYKELAHGAGLNLNKQLLNGTDLTCLLENYPLAKVRVAEKLAGRSAIKEFNHEETSGDTVSTYQLWLQSCGGVGMDHKVSPAEFTHPSPALRHLRQAILARRPKGGVELYWDLPADNEAAVELNRAKNLASLNVKVGGLEMNLEDKATLADPQYGYTLPSQPFRRRRTVARVDFASTQYRLFTDAGRVHSGDSISSVVGALRNSGALDGEHLTIQTAGIAEKDLPFFRAAVKKEVAKIQRDLPLMFINCDAPEVALLEAVVSPGIELDPRSQLTQPISPGGQQQSLSFSTRSHGQNQLFYVDILADRPDVRAEMQQAILDKVAPGFTSDSLYRVTLDAKFRALRKFKLQNKDIQIRFRNKNGVLETGAIVPKTNAPIV